MSTLTPGRNLIGPYAKPKVRCSGWAYRPGTLQISPNDFISLDTPDWFEWLSQEIAFRVEQVYYLADRSLLDPYYLSFTVRPERRQRGQLYWYAYKKYHNRRLKGSYLGPRQEVTLPHLDQLADRYLVQINPDLYTQVCQVSFQTLPRYHPLS